MKRRDVLRVLPALAVPAVTVSAAIGTPAQDTQWQYESTTLMPADMDDKTLQRVLNDRGRDGWIVSAVHLIPGNTQPEGQTRYVLYYRRPTDPHLRQSWMWSTLRVLLPDAAALMTSLNSSGKVGNVLGLVVSGIDGVRYYMTRPSYR